MELERVGSAVPTRRMWGIRAGIKGKAHSLFLQDKIICLSDPGMGDLRKFNTDRAAFYAFYRKLRPEDSQTGVTGIAGKFFRFIHEFKNGDLVVYYALKERCIYIGKVVGPYRFLKSNDEFPHQRAIEWLCSFPKTWLSVSARRELGAARTLFEIKRHREEIERYITKSGGNQSRAANK